MSGIYKSGRRSYIPEAMESFEQQQDKADRLAIKDLKETMPALETNQLSRVEGLILHSLIKSHSNQTFRLRSHGISKSDRLRIMGRSDLKTFFAILRSLERKGFLKISRAGSNSPAECQILKTRDGHPIDKKTTNENLP